MYTTPIPPDLTEKDVNTLLELQNCLNLEEAANWVKTNSKLLHSLRKVEDSIILYNDELIAFGFLIGMAFGALEMVKHLAMTIKNKGQNVKEN